MNIPPKSIAIAVAIGVFIWLINTPIGIYVGMAFWTVVLIWIGNGVMDFINDNNRKD